MRRARPSLLILPAVLLAVLGALPAPLPAAVTRTELELGTIATGGAGGPPVIQWKAAAHIDARFTVGPAAFVLTLDPGILLDGPSQSSTGLTEAYLQYRRLPFDLRVGVERMPLETARLTLPFSIEPVDVVGNRLGWLGARLLWYPNPSTRVRLALIEDAGRMLPAASLRHEFPSFEVEAHVLSISGARTAYGAGVSGLVGDLVVYGELWTLTSPSESRYALGVSGSFADGIWTIEGGYAAALPGAAPRLQLAGQIAYRLTEDLTVTGTSRIFSDPDALRGQAVLQLSWAAGNTEYSVSLATLLGPEPMQGVITAGVSVSF